MQSRRSSKIFNKWTKSNDCAETFYHVLYVREKTSKLRTNMVITFVNIFHKNEYELLIFFSSYNSRCNDFFFFLHLRIQYIMISLRRTMN